MIGFVYFMCFNITCFTMYICKYKSETQIYYRIVSLCCVLFNLLDYRLFNLNLAPKDAKLVVCNGKCIFPIHSHCANRVSEINKLVRNIT